MAAPLLAVRGLGVDIPTPGGMLHPVRGADEWLTASAYDARSARTA